MAPWGWCWPWQCAATQVGGRGGAWGSVGDASWARRPLLPSTAHPAAAPTGTAWPPLAPCAAPHAALGSGPYRERAFFLVGMQALLTVLVQGSVTTPLLRALGYLDLGPAQRAVYREAAAAVEDYGRLVERGARSPKGGGPWQRLLGPPDWGRVHRASQLGVLSQAVEARPPRDRDQPPTLQQRTKVGGRWVGGWHERLQPQAGSITMCMPRMHRPLPPACPAAVQDLRERVLGMAQGCWDEMLDSQFLAPPTHATLREAGEAAADRTDARLASWECLAASMGWVERLEALGRCAGVEGRWSMGAGGGRRGAGVYRALWEAGPFS